MIFHPRFPNFAAIIHHLRRLGRRATIVSPINGAALGFTRAQHRMEALHTSQKGRFPTNVTASAVGLRPICYRSSA